MLTKFEFSFAPTQEEAREGIVANIRAGQPSRFRARFWRFGSQILLGIALSFSATCISIYFDRPDAVPELFSLLLGALSIYLIWLWRWKRATLASSTDMAEFAASYGPTYAVIDHDGLGMTSKIGSVQLPWRAVNRILTTRNVTVLRFGAQMAVIPHRTLPTGIAPLEFDAQLEKWKAAS